MTNNTASIAVLNALIRAERAGIGPRLLEAGVFVEDRSEKVYALADRLAKAAEEHVAELSRLVMERGQTPPAHAVDLRLADLHFQEVGHLLPRIIAEEEQLIRKYDVALTRLKDDPDAVAVVTRLRDRHRTLLEEARKLASPDTVAA